MSDSRPQEQLHQKLCDVMTKLRKQKCMDTESILNHPLMIKFLTKARMTVLHLACHLRNLELVTKMLEEGEDPNKAAGDGTYPIHTVAANMDINFINLKILDKLIEYEVNLDLVDPDGRTPLFLACYCSNVEMVEKLVQAGCDMDISDNYGHTALSVTCGFASQRWYFWNMDCFNDNSRQLRRDQFPAYMMTLSLLRGGADPREVTLLPACVLYGTEEMVRAFLDCGVNVNRVDAYGRLPIICACSTPNIPTSVVQLLLERGSYVKEADIKDSSALGLAFVNNSMEKMRLLLSYGANLDEQDMTELMCRKMKRLFEENAVICPSIKEFLCWSLLMAAGFRPQYEVLELNLRRFCTHENYVRVIEILRGMKSPAQKSLMELCRLRVRSQISSPRMRNKIATLPVPKVIQRFLKFED